MKIRQQDIPYLKGSSFTNGLKFPVAQTETTMSYRLSTLRDMAKDKRVIHVGCVDHLELIQLKLKSGVWLHKLIDDVSAECLGIDNNREGIEYLRKELNYENVFYADLLNEPLPQITSAQWDLMILGEILEHVDNPVAFLTSLHQKYSAYVKGIVLTVPNAFSYINFLKAFRHKEHINTDHRYWFSPYTLCKIMTIAGMEPLEIHFAQSYPMASGKITTRIVQPVLTRYPLFRDTLIVTGRL